MPDNTAALSLLDAHYATQATLVLAIQCPRCFDVSSLSDVETRSRGRCQRCGEPLGDLRALVERYWSVLPVVVGGIAATPLPDTGATSASSETP